MSGVAEAKRVAPAEGFVKRVKARVVRAVRAGYREIMGKPSENERTERSFLPVEMLNRMGIKSSKMEGRMAMVTLIASELSNLHDPSQIEVKLARDYLPALFPNLKLKFQKFLGLEKEDLDVQLTPSQPEKPSIERLMDGSPSAEVEVLMSTMGRTRAIERTEDMMGIPFTIENDLIGLAVLSGKVTDHDIAISKLLAPTISGALRNAMQYRELYSYSIHDGLLTNIYNRKYFDDTIEKEISRAGRSQSRVSIIFGDIDHFGKWNKEDNHTKGDQILRSVATAMAKGVRKADSVCRFGGEEIAIILPDTSQVEAVQTAEKLRMTIEETTPVTISFGVATFPIHAVDAETFIAAASVANNMAKGNRENAPEGSRNRTVTKIDGRWLLAEEAIKELTRREKEAASNQTRKDEEEGKGIGGTSVSGSGVSADAGTHS